MSKLLVIDGHSQMNRAFYALPSFTGPNGEPTGAVYGCLMTLFRALREHTPDHVAFALDSSGPTFRHEQFAEYKAGRKKMPDELRSQFPLLREVLDGLGIRHIALPGYEADDIMGALSEMCRADGMDCRLLTGDRDMMQLVDDRVHVLLTKKDDIVEFTPELVLERFGVDVDHVTDLKGLMGDSSDNIPGIPGVGEKTACKLLGEYGDLENVLAHGGDIKGKLGEKVRDNAELARMSKQLATIETDVPLDISLDALRWTEPGAETGNVFVKYGFQSLMNRLPKGAAPPAVAVATPEASEIEEITVKDAAALEQALASIQDTFALCSYADRIEICDAKRHIIAHLGGNLIDPGLQEPDVYKALRPLLDSKTPRVYEDMKAQFTAMGRATDGFDLRVADYLLDPQRYRKPETACDALSHASDAEMELEETGMQRLYTDIEHPLTWVLMDMENEGFLLDTKVLETLGAEYRANIQSFQQEIFALAGGEFNIQSPKQLGEILFDKLMLPAGRKTKSGYSTDAQVLDSLADKHPIVPLILQYRQVAKLNSTYIEGLLRLAGEDGRVHTRFVQTATATGRISSQEPNLQNIPVRTEQGREIRRAFIAPPGRMLVDADYSQIELRVLAHMAGDEDMRSAFLSGLDIHAYTAAQVGGVPLDEVTSDMRSAAKAVNFGIVYGISDFGLAQNIGVSRTEAAAFIEKYFARYGKIKQFMEDMVERGKQDGYVATLLGRRRYLPELKSNNYNTRSFGARAAMNAPIQGTAADIIKIAMVQVPKALAKANLDAKLILQVHDELIVECAEDIADTVSELLKKVMQSALTLSVPLEVTVMSGKSWYETK